MSGGYFDYLCFKEFPDCINQIKTMEEMEQELIKRGYTDIAEDIRRLIEYCLSAENRIRVLFEKLSPVFHDIEWYYSGDISEKSLIAELEKYRKGE